MTIVDQSLCSPGQSVGQFRLQNRSSFEAVHLVQTLHLHTSKELVNSEYQGSTESVYEPDDQEKKSMQMSGTGLPNRGIILEYLQGYAKRRNSIHRPSIPSHTEHCSHLTVSRICNASARTGTSSCLTRISAKHSSSCVFSSINLG